MSFIGRFTCTQTTPLGDEPNLVDVDIEVEADLYCYDPEDGIEAENVTARLFGCEMPEDVVEELGLGNRAAEVFYESAYVHGSVKPGLYRSKDGRAVEVFSVAKIPNECRWMAVVNRIAPMPFSLRHRDHVELMDVDELLGAYYFFEKEPPDEQLIYVEESAGPEEPPKEGTLCPM